MGSHSLAVYSFKVKQDKSIKNMVEVFEILSKCFNGMEGKSKNMEDREVYYKIDKLMKSDYREIEGIIKVGHYGIGGSIVDVKTEEEKYEKKPNEADMEPHYFLLLSRGLDKNSGFLISERVGNSGIETILEEIIEGCFDGAKLEKDAVLTKDYIKIWIDNLKDVRLYKIVPSKDLTNEIRQEKEEEEIHIEVRLAPGKGKILSSFFSFHMKKYLEDPGSKVIFEVANQFLNEALFSPNAKTEIRDLGFDYISATIKLGSKERRIKFLRNDAVMRPYFEFPDDIGYDDNGWPIYEKVHDFASSLVDEFQKNAGTKA